MAATFIPQIICCLISAAALTIHQRSAVSQTSRIYLHATYRYDPLHASAHRRVQGHAREFYKGRIGSELPVIRHIICRAPYEARYNAWPKA